MRHTHAKIRAEHTHNVKIISHARGASRK